MFITKEAIPGVACYLSPGTSRPFSWCSRPAKAYDLSEADALALAEILKLAVVKLSNPGRLHVVSVFGKADFDKVKAIGLNVADVFDKVGDAAGGDEGFSLDGDAHGCSPGSLEYAAKYLLKAVSA